MGTTHAGRQLLVQPKLQVGKESDPAEREADRIAAQMGASAPERAPASAKDTLGGLPVDSGMEQRINRARSGGEQLDESTMDAMQPSLRTDLSEVRVHTDGVSDKLNQSLQAKAFTTGTDVFFGAGQYSPGTKEGQGLLAHELAHVDQQGGVRRSMVMRSFDPKNADISSITSMTELGGGSANKGVFLLTGEGGKQVVAKFVDEDTRRAQMADDVLDTAGMKSSGAQPYGKGMVGQLTKKIREFAKSKADEGDDATALKLNRAADRADGQAGGVVLMRAMGGIDLGDLLYGKSKAAKPDEKAKADRSGIDAVALLSTPKFHHELGKLWATDGLLGSSDRMSVDKFGGRIQSTNLKVLADGTINTFDSDTVVVANETLQNSSQKDKSTGAWTKWLIEGGRVWDLGLTAPGADLHNLTTMFEVSARKAIFDTLVADFKKFADTLDWSNSNLTFAAFDAQFMAGIVSALTLLVHDLDGIVERTRAVGGDDAGGGAVDADAMRIKGEYLKAILPDLQNNSTVSANSQQAARAKAKAMADQIVKDKTAAQALAKFDASLMPVPQRPATMNTATKMKRSVGRSIGSIGGKSDKSKDSKKAKQLRKGVKDQGLEGTEQALNEVKGMANASQRQRQAAFDIGLQYTILAMNRRAVEFGNADDDLVQLDTAVTDNKVLANSIRPYVAVTRSGGYNQAIANFKLLATGYKAQLNRKGDSGSVKELDQAAKLLDNDGGSFEASVDWVERRLKKANVSV